MKKKLFAKISSLVIAFCMMACTVMPVYATEICDMGGETNEEAENMISAQSTNDVTLGYGQAKSMASFTVVGERNYVYLGKIYLPNDPRIHRILFTAGYAKYSGDTGIGDIDLKVKMARNGVTIYENTFTYEKYNGYINQVEVLNVSMNQAIDVWIDTASAGASNGNIRKIFLTMFDVYTD